MSAMYDTVHIRGFEFTMDGRVILHGDMARPRNTPAEDSAWGEWVDARGGVTHQKLGGAECAYLASLYCNKCGWINPIVYPHKVPMAIGRDLDLLLDAVHVAAVATSGDIGPSQVQRKVRVGWVKAGRLLALMDDYGITEQWNFPRRRVLVTREQVAETQERLRQIAAKEQPE